MIDHGHFDWVKLSELSLTRIGIAQYRLLRAVNRDMEQLPSSLEPWLVSQNAQLAYPCCEKLNSQRMEFDLGKIGQKLWGCSRLMQHASRVQAVCGLCIRRGDAFRAVS